MKEAVKKARLGLAATAMLMVSLDVVTAADVQPATLTLKGTEASYELWGASYVKWAYDGHDVTTATPAELAATH